MSTYVYGITRETTALPKGLAGVGEPPAGLRLVTGGGLAAVVSDCPEQLRPKRRDLLAHQKVVTELAREAPVLPLRFGSVSDDDRRVGEVLTERAERYAGQLDRLDGRVEYNVKAVHQQDAVLHLVLADDPELRALTEANRRAGGGSYDDRLRVGELVAARVKEREQWDAELLTQVLEPLAEECRPGPESSGWFVSLSFLVREAEADRLLNAVGRLGKAYTHLELRVNGPLPPYSFVDS
ncbi:GvpL/GvpF family gas vesicle protein [Streptomyces orinoci]|uniref:GvpL/GvpF family gas vesicle protein n=1 Tax=Streptomyces orinoci TaxID=67339 RepID=A0ABV3JVV0_STRON|nr:GvpL/GvpF family gas vesicle protein [Streptomyces orinoci]